MAKHMAWLDQGLLEEFDDGLEDMELAGLHSSPGYLKLKRLHAALLSQPERIAPIGWTHLGSIAHAMSDPFNHGSFVVDGDEHHNVPLYAGPPIDAAISDRLGAWLSAALDDPAAGDDFKADVRAWFDAGRPGFTLDQEPAND